MGKQTMVTSAGSALVKGYASTVVNAISARNVEGHQYASTIVYAVSARNVEGRQYASTVVNAVRARNVEGHQYAITAVDAVSARNVEVHQYAIMVVNAVVARNAKGVKNEANGTEAEKHAIALPYFPTDNSSPLVVCHFLQTMNASGGKNGVQGLVGYILKFVLNIRNDLSLLSLFYEYLGVYLIISYGFLPLL